MNSNSQIAKNTILLYVRMLIILIISLYTSRLVLSILGEDDFGVYNVVGGVVVLFSFLINAMTSSTQRFLNYSIGLGDENKTANVFSTAILAHISILVLVLILSETIGLWFIMNKLNIPQERYYASLWVYQMSVLTTLINIITIPYRASIIATEKMSIFAYISIIEVILKLLIIIILPYFSTDHLILYSILLTIISFLIFIAYKHICYKKIKFTHFKFCIDKAKYKEQMIFSGWYLFGGLATVGAKQGTNILINIFFHVAVNAAVGIANQVRSAIYGFVSSFQTAFNPQIVKLYASNNHSQLLDLIYRSSKFSYFLLFILSFPVIVYCKEILSIWLVNIPEYTVIFTQLVIISSFAEALSAPLWTAIGAIGKIQRYQFIVSLIIFLDVPLVYIAFKLGYNPTYAFIINVIINIIAYIYRLFYIKKYIKYKIMDYARKVIIPCFKVTLLTIPFPIILEKYNTSVLTSFLFICISILLIILFIILVGLDNNEKRFLHNLITKFLTNKIIKK